MESLQIPLEIKPCLYNGQVFHKRFLPKVHVLNYPLFQIFINLRTLENDVSNLRFFSINRFNLFSFYDKDHGPDQATSKSSPLFERIKKLLAQSRAFSDDHKIFLLAMPRVLGFVFNPISVYFHLAANNKVLHIIYEVNNTFGDRHSYVLDVNDDPINKPLILQTHEKKLHVSPFMEMDLIYNFSISYPLHTFNFKIDVLKKDATMLIAQFSGDRKNLSDTQLIKNALKYPFMTLGAVIAIHYEALIIWIKGISLKPKPLTKKSSVSA